MPRWKELPAQLGEQERQLLVQLRRMKDHSGLSLASLGAKTSYSGSSWERYLNGKKPVPRAAVEELAQVCGADPTRLLVLHEVARAADGRAEPDGGAVEAAAPEAASGPVTRASEPPGPPAEAPPAARAVRLRPALAALALAVAAAFAGGLLTGQAISGDEGDEGRGVFSYAKERTYPCEEGRADGVRYAGYATTATAILDRGSSGWEVVEAQCLLKAHGFGAGKVDGAYGDGTKASVKSFQRARDLVADGIVGPDTWGALRK
ncbi:peptidoglycan-binding protein [Streptomyces sp. NRRL B-1347]|uniref:peptidoglycan-binding protein n=1 Tax=Streptomyces sp. NRRL B-1347 TaxID=1476877 RepID=UPI0004C6AB24|nr:peptidoglycan-binding protein [Streptomyces sp. NRRL B-1347]